MGEWVLIIVMSMSGRPSMSVLPFYSDKESCEKAAEKIEAHFSGWKVEHECIEQK